MSTFPNFTPEQLTVLLLTSWFFSVCLKFSLVLCLSRSALAESLSTHSEEQFENMIRGLFIVISIIDLVFAAEANSITSDNGVGNALQKKGRFISFNNEEGEIKLELDFAIPFMKIPISNKNAGHLVHPTLNVNTRGLVTVGAMLFLFVTVVPKIVKLFIPHAETTTTESLVPLMRRVEEALQSMDISSTECYQRAACWVAGKTPLVNSEWLETMIENEAVQEAINRGMGGVDCTYYKCPLSMNVISQMFKAGRQLLV
ncbi:uncharacterized protein LOC106664057 isoform X2 [Cimex lectularius]|uniref:Uncharacterized protein n=1 Tax=Cimex lectularius TaxID=79782 RepID=A0A8I6TMC6_CIMLE|nr:uncharacterized protein LOC106664057 isoform X2 [Cimex lectularius]